MMLSEVAHKFAPQFVFPLVDYGYITVTEIIGYMLQSIVLPSIEFIYNTVVSLWTSNAEESADWVTGTDNDSMKEEFYGSSFDGSSNNSNGSSDGTGNEDILETAASSSLRTTTTTTTMTTTSTTRRSNRNVAGAPLIDEYDRDEASNGYYSNQFKQQVYHTMDTVSDYATQAKSEIHERLEVSMKGIKAGVKNVNNLNLTKQNVNEMCNYSKDKAVGTINYYKEEYLMHYLELAVDVIENPMALVECGKDYVNEKRETAAEWRTFVQDWIHYAVFKCKDGFNAGCEACVAMKDGKFDYRHAVWRSCHFIQQSMIRVLHYFGRNSIVGRFIEFFNLLGTLQKVKAYVTKGSQTDHKKQY